MMNLILEKNSTLKSDKGHFKTIFLDGRKGLHPPSIDWKARLLQHHGDFGTGGLDTIVIQRFTQWLEKNTIQ